MSSGIEPPIIYKVSMWVIGGLMTLLSLWFWKDHDNTKTTIKDLNNKTEGHSNKLTEHETKFVTDNQVRAIVKSEVEPIKDNGARIEVIVLKLVDSVNELTTEIKASNAVQKYKEQLNKDN